MVVRVVDVVTVEVRVVEVSVEVVHVVDVDVTDVEVRVEVTVEVSVWEVDDVVELVWVEVDVDNQTVIAVEPQAVPSS